jgi:hypothetical protein
MRPLHVLRAKPHITVDLRLWHLIYTVILEYRWHGGTNIYASSENVTRDPRVPDGTARLRFGQKFASRSPFDFREPLDEPFWNAE